MTGPDQQAESAEAIESTGPAEERPVLRVLTPDATPEEVAALVAVFSAIGGGEPPAPRPRSEWASPHHQVRRGRVHGPGRWRGSGLPG